MKTSRRIALVLGLVAPLVAFAHPGHDGDHGLTWDFGHLAGHPLATLACLTVLGAAGWLGWRLIRSIRSPQASRVKRKD
jgi:hydrogenase/urease accessory protein HupE